MAASQHEALRLLVSGSLVAVQPKGTSGGKVETLSVDLVSGDVKLTQQPALGSACEDVLALVGAFRLRAGTAVAVVTGAQKVGGAGGACDCGAARCSGGSGSSSSSEAKTDHVSFTNLLLPTAPPTAPPRSPPSTASPCSAPPPPSC
jgi:hypothetical protein